MIPTADGGWWVLQASSPQALLALDPDLGVISHVVLSRSAGRCALAGAARGSAWLVVADKRRVRRLERSGVESESATLALPGSGGAAVWRNGGALVCAGGALLCFDRRGFTRPVKLMIQSSVLSASVCIV